MQTPLSRLSCVIFDMDGTLTRTNDLIFASFNHVMEKYLAKRLSPEEIIALFGPPEETTFDRLLGSELGAAAMDDMCAYYRSNHHDMAILHQGVDVMLHHLREKGIKLALFTGKGKRTAQISLEVLNITHYFDLVVSGSDVENHKPHPEGISKVLAEFALSPDQVLMVGDAIADIKASRSAGVKMAAVVWDSYDKEGVLGADADFVFHAVGEMDEWFRTNLN